MIPRALRREVTECSLVLCGETNGLGEQPMAPGGANKATSATSYRSGET
jgi:hypothetical protein